MKIKLGANDISAQDIALWCRGELYDYTDEHGSPTVSYVCTDSREADADTLFIATRGERVDGHDYITSALDAGCRVVLCEYVPVDIAGRNVAFITVENSIDAFAYAAKGYRSGRELDVVAITGSVGKTTTKDLCASVLSRFTSLYATKGNFNSVIGMPMSLLELPKTCDTAIFEMGMSSRGEISHMTNTANPLIAMVTNVGSSHLEYLKTRENIALAKLEIAQGLSEGGYLLLNGDEPLLHKLHKTRAKKYSTLYVSIEDEKSDFFADNISVSDTGTYFDLHYGGKMYQSLKISLVGKHFVYNACFAAAAAILLGGSEDDIRIGLASYVPDGLRQNIISKNGITVISDCYNAAPESMRAALDTLSSISVSGKRIAVLGDMRELGDSSDKMHAEIGRYLVQRGIDILLTLGESGALIAESAISFGMSPSSVFAQKDIDDLDNFTAELSARLSVGDAVLVKASRALSLERVIDKVFS